MPELHHQSGPPQADGQPDYSGLSDAELTERIRSGAPQAHPAVQELKRRHLPAVLAYARLCGRNQTAGTQQARQLVDRMWLERVAEQAGWEGETDPERLTRAFEALETAGITLPHRGRAGGTEAQRDRLPRRSRHR
ncbi:hypothetical protein ABZW02_35635, partial [Streptomyces sp. NPDC005180]